MSITCWTVKEAVVITAADWTSSQVRLDVVRWASGERRWTPAQWERAERELKAAIELTPRDATLHEHLALLYTVKGRADWGDGGVESPGVRLYRQALAEQELAVEIRPLQANSWANLALTRYAVGESIESTYDAWTRALELGPNEPEVKRTLEAVVTLDWRDAPDHALAWLEEVRPGKLSSLKAEAEPKSEPKQ